MLSLPPVDGSHRAANAPLPVENADLLGATAKGDQRGAVLADSDRCDGLGDRVLRVRLRRRR